MSPVRALGRAGLASLLLASGSQPACLFGSCEAIGCAYGGDVTVFEMWDVDWEPYQEAELTFTVELPDGDRVCSGSVRTLSCDDGLDAQRWANGTDDDATHGIDAVLVDGFPATVGFRVEIDGEIVYDESHEPVRQRDRVGNCTVCTAFVVQTAW